MDPDYLFEWKAPESREVIRQRVQALKESGMSAEQFQDREAFRRARGPALESAEVPDDAYYDGKAARLACDFLAEGQLATRGASATLPGEKPYFLGVGFVAPHTPFRAPKRYWDLYDRGALTLHSSREWPRGSKEWMAGDSEPAQYYTTNGYSKLWRPTEVQLRELLHGHYATTSYIDALIGRILEAARERGDWDNTIVVFTSDHGFSEGQHGYWGKHNMWDASLHVPLFIRPAQGGRSLRIPHVTEHVDIYPTLCEMAGIGVPQHCEGRTMIPLLEDPHTDWKDVALSRRKPMWHDRLPVYESSDSLRTPRYRYTEYLDAAGKLLGAELFDYGADPLESVNLADAAEHAPLREELAARLHRAVESNGRLL